MEHPELFEDDTPFCERPNFDETLGIMYGSMKKHEEEYNRGLRESENTPEASGSTIQTPP